MKKTIFLFFAAILCAMSATAATYYYCGGKNSWGATPMTLSADGAYYYYQASAGAHEFKLTDNDSWSGAEYTNITPTKYNKTDITLSKPGNVKSPSTAAHYILLYFGNDNATPVVCASTTLPNGLNDVWIKHDWGGAGSWTYKQATNNGDGTFSLSANYGASGCNVNAYNGSNAQWYYGVSDMEVEAGLQKGDEAVFTVNAVTRKITITKKVNKNLGDITITMNCNQQPNIYFWDVEGQTCAEWPGETMTAAGSNTYTYKFTNVDLDLGVNYKITLKKVNENEWATGDLHTTTDVTLSAADLNIPQVAVMGVNNWGEGDKMTVSDDYLSASVTLTLNEIKKYDLKLKIGEDWKGHKEQNHITRAATSSVFKDNDDNGSVDVDYPGDYVFTYTYKTQTLEVTYPELPTPEYKDITIQVYAKQVPNIWWWNGGDQCADASASHTWETAPAMEPVTGEDNWYTKTFTQVDITKGGIKFKLKSQDQSIEGNELQTTEDKCYDARVITAVTETTCGELPSGEVPTVTYNVTVPIGTPACYIAGQMNGWALQAMTKVDDTHYTITIEGAQKTQEYKYSASNNWDLVELNEDGSEKSNRTWSDNDVVAKWATPPTYTIVGATEITGVNWDPANAENVMAKDGEAYTLTKTGLKLVAGDYGYKVAKNGAWGDGEYPASGDQTLNIAENGEYTIVYTYTVGTSLTAVATKTGEYTPAPVEVKYYLVGTMNSWTNGDATYELSLEGDGLYHYDVALNAGTHEFKVYDATGVNTYGYSQLTKKNYNELSEGEYNNIKLTLTADAAVTITFNGETKAITLESTALTEIVLPRTYTVTVPAGTAKCYICGAWDWNTFMEMTPTANANEFTINIVGATAEQQYKYTRGEGWEYAEVNADGSTRANRTYNANDVVEKWADVITYVLMGVNGDWTTGIQLTKNSETEYMLLGQTITRNTDKIKVVTLTNGTATAWCGNVDTYSDAIYENDWDNDGNIALEDGIYDFYFKVSEDKIYIDQTTLLRTGTNKYGTIYVPYTPASVSGATFYQVAGKEEGKVYLESVNTVEAGKPYIYERTGNQVVKIEFSGAKATNGGAVNGLVGTDATATTIAPGHYLLYNNAFCKSDGSSKVRGYRAYLVMEDIVGGAPTQMPGRRYIGMSVQGENEATGLDNITNGENTVIKTIENGQLIIIRNGEKFNAQGVKL